MVETEEGSAPIDIKCIDLSTFAHGSYAENLKIGRQIAKSFEEIGFAYIKNHGIPQKVIDQAHGEGANFFTLPQEVKKRYSKGNIVNQGFVEINREKLHSDENVLELRESYDIRDKYGVFPEEVPQFRKEMINLIEHGKMLADILLHCIELGLGLPPNFLSKKHQKHFTNQSGTLLRVLHYPPVPEGTKENATRCGAHTDYGTFTLLFQDQMGGLEVQNRDGQWVKANPIPGTILINVGDLLQIWTGGDFVATKHRVLVPYEELKRRCERRSIVLFFHPDDDVLVEPLLPSNSEYKSIRALDHLNSRYSETYKY